MAKGLEIKADQNRQIGRIWDLPETIKAFAIPNTRDPARLGATYKELTRAFNILDCSAGQLAYLKGAILIKVKELLSHGEFTEWCKQYCRDSERQIQRFMRIAHSCGSRADATGKTITKLLETAISEEELERNRKKKKNADPPPKPPFYTLGNQAASLPKPLEAFAGKLRSTEWVRPESSTILENWREYIVATYQQLRQVKAAYREAVKKAAQMAEDAENGVIGKSREAG